MRLKSSGTITHSLRRRLRAVTGPIRERASNLLPERVEADGSDPDDWLQTALDVVLPPPSRTVAGEKVLGDQASVAWVRNTGKPADGVCRAESGSWPRFYSVIDALRLSANVKPPKLPGGSGSTESFSLQRSTDQ